MSKHFFIAILLFFSHNIKGQINYLTQKGVNNYINRAFSNLVTGQGSSVEPANFASLDPANGSFTFKGVTPVKFKKDAIGRISFLSIKIEGDLISNSYSALFTNSVLNTNAAVQGEYNFWFGKHHIGFKLSDSANIALKRNQIYNWRNAQYASLYAQRLIISQQLITDSLKFQTTQYDIRKEREKLRIVDSIRNLYTCFTNQGCDSLKKYNDSLQNVVNKISLLENNRLQLSLKIDSIRNRINLDRDSSLVDYEKELVSNEAKRKIAEIENNAPVALYTLKWFTIVGGVGNRKFYSFNSALPLSEQISSKEYTTSRFGLAFNWFKRDLLAKKSMYINIGILRIVDNNTSLLSTTEINQERIFKNTSGDTVRKVLRKYNAYTDPIAEFKNWQFFTNFYYLFGDKTSGLHLFPNFSLFDDNTKQLNFGIGYIISFKNSKKDQPIINAEGYINFIDLSNGLKTDKTNQSRNEIGIRFTLPLNLFNL